MTADIWVFLVGIWRSYMCLGLHIYDHRYMSINCWYMTIIYVSWFTHIWVTIYEYYLLVYDGHICVWPRTYMIQYGESYMCLFMLIYDGSYMIELDYHMSVNIWSYVLVYDLHVYDSLHVYDAHIWSCRHMTLIYDPFFPWDAEYYFTFDGRFWTLIYLVRTLFYYFLRTRIFYTLRILFIYILRTCYWFTFYGCYLEGRVTDLVKIRFTDNYS